MEEKRDKRGRTEAEAIAAYQQKNYPKPALTADVALFARDQEQFKVLLIRRGNHPYLGCWALPGGFANPDESIQATAFRELQEETGIQLSTLQQVGVYSQPGRDPRGWVVSVAFTALLKMGMVDALAADDAAQAEWIPVHCDGKQISVELPKGEPLAFDHQAIIEDAWRHITLLSNAEDILSWANDETMRDKRDV